MLWWLFWVSSLLEIIPVCVAWLSLEFLAYKKLEARVKASVPMCLTGNKTQGT